MRVSVIGAGPTGLTAAHRLARAGAEVDLFEAAPGVGGLARSLSLWGRQVDLGSHVFSTSDPTVRQLWLRLLGNDVRWLPLRRGVFTGQTIVQYPIQISDLVRRQSLATTLRCGLGLVAHRMARTPRAPADAEAWMIRHYGRPLFERFFEQYARKLWGVPCRDIDAAFAQFLFGESASTVTVDGRFPYPAHGTGSVWDRMAAELTSAGGRLHLATPIRGLRAQDGRASGVLTDGGAYPADHVVSSLPLPLLVRSLPGVPPELRGAVTGLRTRSTVLVYLRLTQADLFDSNWLYVYPPDYRIGRVTNIDAWLSDDDPPDDSVVCLEFWCDHGDATWSADDGELVAWAADDLLRTGLAGPARVLDSHLVRLRGSHPVPALGCREVLAATQAYVESVPGLTSIGRHGQFGIPGVGACMEAAFAAADDLTAELNRPGTA